ncbi:ABC transporter ATP-binding protein/permease, partial [Alphaproteobacteria bacterium]|nr:ABC transporter ATP-binding protein/permease [Alphaproteobacteria bacterium]
IPFWLTRSVYDHSQKITERKMESWKNKLGFTSDLLQSVTRSKIDALEETIIENARPILRANAQWRVDKARLQGRQLAIMEGLSFFGLLTLMLAGLMAFDLTLASLVVLVVIFNRLKSYANQINTGLIALKETYPHCKQYLAICSELGEEFEIRPMPSDQHIPSIDRIDVNQVDFEYEPDNPVLQGINFSAEAGDRILIQGRSGDGKSTFLELLCGILPPQRGEILYNGEPLDEAAFYRMRSAIAYVAPTLYLFNETLRKNLTIGTTGDEARLKRAVKFAGLENVIADLPHGLDSEIGPDGENLSLGERQRVILGRIFMQDPQLIIFDEATANLNRELEQNIMEMLQGAVDPSCIIVIVAHKEPEGIVFNKRYVMSNGELHKAQSMPAEEFVTSP